MRELGKADCPCGSHRCVTLGCVVWLARPPMICKLIGRLRLVTPFS